MTRRLWAPSTAIDFLLFLTLTCLLDWPTGFVVEAGPVPFYLEQQDDDGEPYRAGSRAQPKVMDTGVEFLVDYDKKWRGNGPTSQLQDDTTEQEEEEEEEARNQDNSESEAVTSGLRTDEVGRLSRPPLVRQDAFDMGDDDLEEAELERIRNSVDRLLQQKRRTKRARIALISAARDSEDEDNDDDNVELDQAPREAYRDGYKYPVLSRRRRPRDVEEEEQNQFDEEVEPDNEEIGSPSPSPEVVQILQPKTLQEARALADMDLDPSYRLNEDELERNDDERDSDQDDNSSLLDQRDNLSRDIERRLAKRSNQEDESGYEYDAEDQDEPDSDFDREDIPDQAIIVPGDDDQDDGSTNYDAREPSPGQMIRRRRAMGNVYNSQLDSEENSDDENQAQEAQDELDRDEWLAQRQAQFDEALKQSSNAIEEPSPDDNVEPAISARFRVCMMVRETFYKELVFTGRTLEVDECVVTCERKDGERVFSHIFKLVDWPCGQRLEGKCLRDGSCSAFV